MKSINSKEPVARFADVRTYVPFLAKHEGVARVLESLLSYPKVRRLFADAADEENVPAAVVERMGLRVRLEGLAEKIPATGPVIVVCNHAYGGADALAVMSEVMKLRSDFKALANRETALLGGVSPLVFPVSILDPERSSENIASIRAMLRHVREGGSLVLFPAGRVAFWQGDRMRDPAWNRQVVRLIQRMDAPIIPLWFFGSPPPVINFLSRLSGFVRMALIPTALAKMEGCEIVGRVGDPCDEKFFKAMGVEAGPWLRRRLEALYDLGN